ncbi:angiopoietin-like protein 8 isoform X2 [Syngnathus typhle]|uniref:angiopoietin-like protein 8 isoform X2 n=1 Tax=Syngnathus typhle TaxID=161592 RepID=UPI002A6A2F3D|nr:angiopoietin-like protein 8 isoform X2 [Syngnathus typhle]
MMIWSLRLFYLSALLGAVRARPVKHADRAAPREDVNVLMFGVLQLGESLNSVYESTEGKVANILLTMKEHEGNLKRLGEQTAQAGEVEKQMKEVIELLQEQMFQQETQAKTAEGRLADIEREQAQLWTKVKSLEAYLNSTFPASIKELQFQKQKIDKQAKQLAALQRLVSGDASVGSALSSLQ